LPPRAANHVSAHDFVFASHANGQPLRCLTAIDAFAHEGLAIDVARSIRSGHMIGVLSRSMRVHGAPACLRSDSGLEFVSHAILQWLTNAHIEKAGIDPGKRWQNVLKESLKGECGDACPGVEWFRTRREAQVVIEAWR
jgi:putative transposase